MVLFFSLLAVITKLRTGAPGLTTSSYSSKSSTSRSHVPDNHHTMHRGWCVGDLVIRAHKASSSVPHSPRWSNHVTHPSLPACGHRDLPLREDKRKMLGPRISLPLRARAWQELHTGLFKGKYEVLHVRQALLLERRPDELAIVRDLEGSCGEETRLDDVASEPHKHQCADLVILHAHAEGRRRGLQGFKYGIHEEHKPVCGHLGIRHQLSQDRPFHRRRILSSTDLELFQRSSFQNHFDLFKGPSVLSASAVLDDHLSSLPFRCHQLLPCFQ